MQGFPQYGISNKINPFKLNLGMVPSILGFVCKPDMPPHINILFRARPNLEWIPLPKKPAVKNYTGIYDSDPQRNVLDLFEKNKPQMEFNDFSKKNSKIKKIIENNEINRQVNRRKLKECKLIFYFLVSFFWVSFLNLKYSFNLKNESKILFIIK